MANVSCVFIKLCVLFSIVLNVIDSKVIDSKYFWWEFALCRKYKIKMCAICGGNFRIKALNDALRRMVTLSFSQSNWAHREPVLEFRIRFHFLFVWLVGCCVFGRRIGRFCVKIRRDSVAVFGACDSVDYWLLWLGNTKGKKSTIRGTLVNNCPLCCWEEWKQFILYEWSEAKRFRSFSSSGVETTVFVQFLGAFASIKGSPSFDFNNVLMCCVWLCVYV